MPALTMPLFVSHADVILRMQVNGTLPGITDVIDSAVIGAQIQVQALLHSKLEVVQQDCTFFLDRQSFSDLQPGGVFRLEIPSGFIREDTPVVITFGSTWNLTDAQTADATLYRVEKPQGYVLMDARTYADKYVRVQCATGFALLPVPAFTGTPAAWDVATTYAAGTPVTYAGQIFVAQTTVVATAPGSDITKWVQVAMVPEQIPPELYEAIMVFVAPVLDSSQATNRNQEQEPQAKKASDRAQLILAPYLRLKGFSFRPLWT